MIATPCHLPLTITLVSNHNIPPALRYVYSSLWGASKGIGTFQMCNMAYIWIKTTPNRPFKLIFKKYVFSGLTFLNENRLFKIKYTKIFPNKFEQILMIETQILFAPTISLRKYEFSVLNHWECLLAIQNSCLK